MKSTIYFVLAGVSLGTAASAKPYNCDNIILVLCAAWQLREGLSAKRKEAGK